MSRASGREGHHWRGSGGLVFARPVTCNRCGSICPMCREVWAVELLVKRFARPRNRDRKTWKGASPEATRGSVIRSGRETVVTAERKSERERGRVRCRAVPPRSRLDTAFHASLKPALSPASPGVSVNSWAQQRHLLFVALIPPKVSDLGPSLKARTRSPSASPAQSPAPTPVTAMRVNSRPPPSPLSAKRDTVSTPLV